MKKIEALGKVLSRNELKQINGGSLYICTCFGGDFGTPPTGTFQTYNNSYDYSRCPAGSNRMTCNPVAQE